MKEPVHAINKGFCFNRGFIHKVKIGHGSFNTIPNPLRQLPAKNLIIPEAPLKSIYFKGLNYFTKLLWFGFQQRITYALEFNGMV
jgi:hypothetical protein